MSIPSSGARTLTAEDEADIVAAYLGGESQRSIADRLGVTQTTVSSVWVGR